MSFFKSIVVKLVAVVVLFLIFALLIRHYVLFPTLKEDAIKLTQEQQESTVSFVAESVSKDLESRLELLDNISKTLDANVLQDREQLDEQLEIFQTLSPLFNYGLIVVSGDGKRVLSDYPRIGSREALDYSEMKWFQKVKQEKTSTIGTPYKEQNTDYPILMMAAPIFDADKNIMAVVGGMTILNNPSFLDVITRVKLGQKGKVSIVCQKHGLYIASSEHSLTMKSYPSDTDSKSLYEKILETQRGSDVIVNDAGKKELVYVRRIDDANWLLLAVIPEEGLLKLPKHMYEVVTQKMYIGIAILAAALFFIIRYILSPLFNASRLIKKMAEGRMEAKSIPVDSHDELGELVMGFNAFVEKTKRFDQQLKILLDDLPIAMALHRDGVLLYVNKSFRELVGAGQHEKIEGMMVMGFITSGSQKIVEQRLNVGHHKHSSKPVEYKVKRLDGSAVWVEVRANIVTYESKDTILAIIVDMEERKKQELTLKMQKHEYALRFDSEKAKVSKLKEEREERERHLIQQSKLAMMGNMIGAIAHQLKQPLSSMSMLCLNVADSYEEQSLNPEKMHEFQAMINEQILYMSETINDFRNFFRPDKAAQSFDLKENIEIVLRMLAKQLVKHSIKVDINADEKIKIHGYANDFKQVMINLLINAIDAFVSSKAASPRIAIVLQNREEDNYISVSDNAGGIDGSLLPQALFKEHMSTKGDQGSGIGLFIVKMIIEGQMKGSVSAKNIETKESGKGAMFEITLPKVS